MDSTGMEAWVLVLLVNIAVVYSGQLPEYIHLCHRHDPEINKCIQETIENLRPNLIAGMPELNVPSIEPLYIDELIATGGNGLNVVTKELKIHGGSNFTVKHIDVDVDRRKFNFAVSFPHLLVDGKYEVDGKIIMIPIQGNGAMQADVYEVDTQIDLKSELNNRDGGEYIKFTGMDMDLHIGKGKVKLDNLFGGDKLIGDVINAAINLNFQYFIKELNPTIIAALTQFVTRSANQIVDQVPFTEVFPL